MRLVITAVGKLKDGAERDLLARYAGRATATGRSLGLGPLEIREIGEGRAPARETRLADEAQRLLSKSADVGCRILLDEGGKAMSSMAFAHLLRDLRDGGESGVGFVIGGPDGHGETMRAATRTTLSLGPMTLPHGLARIVLAEQIYRAITILSGHPYHRG